MNGGARPGAGRKVGSKANHTIEAIAIREKLVETVNKNLEPLLTAKLDLTLGHFVEEVKSDGTTRTYFKSPDNNSIQYLLNQTIGKPKESLDVTSKGKSMAALISTIDAD